MLNTKNVIILLLKLLLFSNIFISKSYADTSKIFEDEMVEINLLTQLEGINENGIFYLGIEFILEKDWKIYWKSPGDSGMPPVLDLSLSTNIQKYEIKWPVPERIKESNKIITNVYLNKIILPLFIVVDDINNPIELKGNLSFQVCKTICIPLEANINIFIPVIGPLDEKNTHKIERAISSIPLNSLQLGIIDSELMFISKEILRLTIERNVAFPKGTANAFILKDTGESFRIKKINNIRNFGDTKISLDIVVDENNIEKYFSKNKVDIIFSKGNLQFYTSLNILPEEYSNIFIIIFIAILGGFILNLMPCVLPVLSLKVSRFISNSNSSNLEIKYNFFATALGIITSFFLLALMTIAIKIAGGAIGWGIQFQQPYFIAFLIFILLLFASNLFGLFQFTFPSSINTNLDKFLRTKKGVTIAFLEGMFATLLATPCSAPFLGTAVSYALTSSIYVTLIVFSFLGIGMSIPYLLFFIYPNFIKFLPKPGKWMKKLNFLLGLGLVLSALWLMSVSIDLSSSILVLCTLAITIVFILFYSNRTLYRTFFFTFSLIIFGIIVYFNAFSYATKDKTNSNFLWVQFDENKISEHVNQGKIVFVDITAEWCVTCKINKVLVLDNKKVKKLFSSKEVVLLRGDWTKPDKDISEFLYSWGRYGIPLNVIYGPKESKGILLPEILSVKTIEKSLSKVR